MSRDSQLPSENDMRTPCASDKTRIMPSEQSTVASRTVTQVLPVGCEASSRSPGLVSNESPCAQGLTLVLPVPNEQSSQQTISSEAVAAEPYKVAPVRLQHTLVWPGLTAQASENGIPDVADSTDATARAESNGPITRIAQPSEWLPKASAATSVREVEAITDCAEPNIEIETVTQDTPCERASRRGVLPFRISERLSALPVRHKVLLALVPIAVVAAVHALNTQHVSPTTARHTHAAGRATKEVTPMVASTIATEPMRDVPAPPASASGARSYSQRTLLREAADAIAEGNYAKARTLYAQLQAADPKNAAYGAALRIIDRHLEKPR